ncbi:hypothetical protein [Spongiimicrobium salis]|uniref:hypothetical protein n=1 Tax=Spongiimicrobium salis TaxID=1667022 RepID=UPI00374D0584
MGQDLREMFGKEKETNFSMKEGHEARFMDRLDADLPVQKRSYRGLLKVAAVFVLFISLGGILLMTSTEGKPEEEVVNNTTAEEDETISLGDLSPDLKKVENYYVANISLELSQLEVSEENKLLVDSFMERLKELNIDYEVLNEELNEIGPNDQTITALIKNLQLRLQLLQQLKAKLNELKSSRNETVDI